MPAEETHWMARNQIAALRTRAMQIREDAQNPAHSVEHWRMRTRTAEELGRIANHFEKWLPELVEFPPAEQLETERRKNAEAQRTIATLESELAIAKPAAQAAVKYSDEVGACVACGYWQAGDSELNEDHSPECPVYLFKVSDRSEVHHG